MRYNGLVQAGKGFQLLWGVQGEGGVAQVVIGGGLHAGQVGALYLSGVRHPALKAGYIELHRAHGGRQAAQKDHAALPRAPEYPEALAQQHLGHKAARRAPHHHENQERPRPAGQQRVQNVVKDSAQCHSGAEGHTVFEHRAHPADADHVAGALQMPAAVGRQGQPCQHQPDEGVQGGIAQTGKVGIAQHAVSGGVRYGIILDVTGLGEQQHRGEPDAQLLQPGSAGEAEEKFLGHTAEDPAQPGGQAIENHIEGGQGQHVAGEHGAEHGKGVEEEPEQAHHHQPGEQAAEHHCAGKDLRRQGQQEHRQIGQQQEQKPRQVVGEEQALPPQGQGVKHAHRAAGIEVGEHRHGAQQAEQSGQRNGGARAAVQVVQGQAAGHSPVPMYPVGQNIEGQHRQPEQAVQRPDGPEAGEILAQQGKIKVRCRGPHSPHLPAHR